MKKLLTPLTVLACLLVPFMATSFAASAATPDDGTLLDLIKPVWEAITGKHYWLACAAGLVAGIALVKKYAPASVRKYTDSDVGGSLMVVGLAFGGALVASLSGATAVPMSGALAIAALKVALVTAGGYSLIRKLVVDPLLASKWYQDKAPAWLKSVLGIVTWVYSKPDVAAEAEKAGDDAVKNNPSPGADGPAGKPTDL